MAPNWPRKMAPLTHTTTPPPYYGPRINPRYLGGLYPNGSFPNGRNFGDLYPSGSHSHDHYPWCPQYNGFSSGGDNDNLGGGYSGSRYSYPPYSHYPMGAQPPRQPYIPAPSSSSMPAKWDLVGPPPDGFHDWQSYNDYMEEFDEDDRWGNAGRRRKFIQEGWDRMNPKQPEPAPAPEPGPEMQIELNAGPGAPATAKWSANKWWRE